MNHLLSQAITLPGTEKTSTVLAGPLVGADYTNIGSILHKIFVIALPIAGIGLLIMIISAGFTLLTSAGDTKKMEKGKQTLTYAIVGFLVIFVAFWLTQLLGIVFGIGAIGAIFK